MNALVVVEQDPSLKPFVAAIAVRLANEGIPVRAIARSVRLPSEDIYETLKEAIDRGTLVELPKDDWPVGSTKGDRNALASSPLDNEEVLRFACARCFKATRLEAAILAVMLKRNEVTKKQLHLVIEQSRPGEKREETDPKMVDVIICHLRKKLREHQLEIETVWGIGYLIPTADRQRAVSMLTAVARDHVKVA